MQTRSRGVLTLSGIKPKPEPEKPKPKPKIQSRPAPKAKQNKDALENSRRILNPKYRQAHLERIASALGVEDIETLPPFFTTEVLRPAKIGIKEDIFTRYGIEKSDKEKRKLVGYRLRPFFRDLTYLNAVLDDPKRYDLDLNPVGEVSEQHRKNTLSLIKHRLEQFRANRETKQAKQSAA